MIPSRLGQHYVAHVACPPRSEWECPPCCTDGVEVMAPKFGVDCLTRQTFRLYSHKSYQNGMLCIFPASSACVASRRRALRVPAIGDRGPFAHLGCAFEDTYFFTLHFERWLGQRLARRAFLRCRCSCVSVLCTARGQLRKKAPHADKAD